LKLVKEKSGWNKAENKKYSRGVAAYFCHNSYAAHVVDMTMKTDNLMSKEYSVPLIVEL
jgi:isoquinoline 1-oxidoreductase beta subunit